MNIKNIQNNKGFTLIELSISIFVLAIAIIGAYNAFTTMDILTSNSTNRFVAVYLAQEGIEIIRNIRDTNWIEEEDWDNGLTECQDGCEADYKTFGDTSTPLYPWSGEGNNLWTNDTSYAYFYPSDYTNCVETQFKRKITITPLSINGIYDVLKVRVEVFWEEKDNIFNLELNDFENSITVEEYLYNWY